MRSSPPVRAWERPNSPGSPYSLDLAALELDSRSGASSPALPKQHVDRVMSEDIDGPSDFTQNLEKWMTGGTLNSKFGSVRSGMPRVEEGRKEGEGSVERQEVEHDNERTPSRYTPTDSPPRVSVFASSRQNGLDDTTGSDWDPYVQEATPQPPPHRQTLQPTVEDYYRELTPARPASTRVPQPAREEHPPTTEDDPPQDDAEVASPGRPSSETVSPVRSPVRSPVLQHAMPRQISPPTAGETLEQQMQELNKKCQRLEHLNKALSTAIDEERRLRKEDQAAHEIEAAEALSREREFAETRARTFEHKDDFRREFSELQQRLQEREQELERVTNYYSKETEGIKQKLEQEKTDHVQEVQVLEQDLELAQRGREDANELARMAREDYDDIRTERNADVTKTSSLQSQLSDLRDQLHAMTQENESLKASRASADEITNNIRAELSLLKQTQQEETARLVGDHRRAMRMAEDLRSQLTDLRQQSRDHQGSRTLEQDQPTPSDPDVAATRDQQTELDDMQTALNTAILERDALQDDLSALQGSHAALEADVAVLTAHPPNHKGELAALRAQIQALNLDIENKDAENEEMDSLVSTDFELREAELLQQLEDAKQERKIMVKALLRQWGREEVGVARGRRPQVYAYLSRNAKGGA